MLVDKLDNAFVVNLFALQHTEYVALHVLNHMHQFKLAPAHALVGAWKLKDAVAFSIYLLGNEHVTASLLKERLYCVAINTNNGVRVDILNRKMVVRTSELIHLAKAYFE